MISLANFFSDSDFSEPGNQIDGQKMWNCKAYIFRSKSENSIMAGLTYNFSIAT